MKVTLHKPVDPQLSKYIECIYSIRRQNAAEPLEYITFPSIFTIIAISAATETTTENDRILIRQKRDAPLESHIVGNFNNPVSVRYEGATDEITIYFKPLGVNAFIDKELAHYTKDSFDNFEPYPDYKDAMAGVFALETDDERFRAVESYWLSKLRGFDNPMLKRMVGAITGEAAEMLTVDGLSRMIGTSRASINRNFQKHLCKTPLQFKKIVRFRNALQNYLADHPDKKLTDITYDLNYFDQSHMIKDFRSLTGYSPKRFFSRIDGLERDSLVWLFL